MVPAAADADRGPGGASDPAELEVLRCCIERTGDPDLQVDDDLWEAGLESLEAVVLCDMLAQGGWGTLEPGDLVEARTPARIRALLGRADPPDTTVVTFHVDGRREPIFAVPPGGGTALTFVRLAAALGSDQPVHVIEPRGMHRPGPIDRTIDAMADHVQAEIEDRLAPGERACLLSYSSGAPIAHEVAGRFRTGGRDAVLVMLDAEPICPEPDFRAGPRPVAPAAPSARARSLVRRLARPGDLARDLRTRRTRRRTDHATAALVVDPGPPSLDPRRYRVLLDLTIEAWNRHTPRPTDVPTLWVRAEDNTGPTPDPTLVQIVETVTAGADHESVLTPPAVDEIAVAVRRFLAATRT